MKYIAYTIYGGQQVYPRSTWYDTELEAQKAGNSNRKGGEAIGVVHTDSTHPFDRSLLASITKDHSMYGDRYL